MFHEYEQTLKMLQNFYFVIWSKHFVLDQHGKTRTVLKRTKSRNQILKILCLTQIQIKMASHKMKNSNLIATLVFEISFIPTSNFAKANYRPLMMTTSNTIFLT